MNVLSEIKASFSNQQIPQIATLMDYWMGDEMPFSYEPMMILYDGYGRYEPTHLDDFFKGYNSLYFFKMIINKLMQTEKIESCKIVGHLRTIDYLLDHKMDAIEPTNIETIKDLLVKLDFLYREEL